MRHRVDLGSQTESVKKQLFAAGTGNPKSASEPGHGSSKSDGGVSAAGWSRRPRSVPQSPDFSLIHDVQMRATGANIHAVAQQLQIYVSAVECGSMLHAKTVELQLRAFLAAAR
jgi:hypothetical protein